MNCPLGLPSPYRIKTYTIWDSDIESPITLQTREGSKLDVLFSKAIEDVKEKFPFAQIVITKHGEVYAVRPVTANPEEKSCPPSPKPN